MTDTRNRPGKSRTSSIASVFWAMVVRPRSALDHLARDRSIRPAVLITLVSVGLTWLNMLIFAAAGQDWLGTRDQLTEPTYVGYFGYLRVGLENWVPIFAGMVLLLAVLGLVVLPGLAQLAAKFWGGTGTFEQMVNTLTFALLVPSVTIRQTSELVFGVPANTLSGHPAWWTAAMNGELGTVSEVVWNGFVIGVYAVGFDLWVIALGTLAIRRVQRIPLWSAAVVMVAGYALWMYGIEATFVR